MMRFINERVKINLEMRENAMYTLDLTLHQTIQCFNNSLGKTFWKPHWKRRKCCSLPQCLLFFHRQHSYLVDWLIVWCLMLFLTLFQLYCGCQCTYPCFPGVLLTSTLHNILSKPLAAFLHNHCQNNRQWWERNESCRNDYHQSLERIWIEPATSCSQVRNATYELWGSADHIWS